MTELVGKLRKHVVRRQVGNDMFVLERPGPGPGQHEETMTLEGHRFTMEFLHCCEIKARAPNLLFTRHELVLKLDDKKIASG